MTMFGYFVITGHSVGLDNAYSDIPDGIKQLLHVLTAINMQKKRLLTFWKSKKNRNRRSWICQSMKSRKLRKLRKLHWSWASPSGTLQFSTSVEHRAILLVGSSWSQIVLSNRSNDFLDFWHIDRGWLVGVPDTAGFSGKTLDHSIIMQNMHFSTVIIFL